MLLMGKAGINLLVPTLNAMFTVQEVNCFERHYKKMPGERLEKRSKNETFCQELVLVNYEGSSGKI